MAKGRVLIPLVGIVVGVLALGCGQSNRITGSRQPDRLSSAGVSTLQTFALAQPPADAITHTVPLIAERTEAAGDVTVWLEGRILKVRYATAGGWVIDATHLAVAATLEGVPRNPAGRPTLGGFPYGATLAPPASEWTGEVDLQAAGLADAATLYLAAQADVSIPSPTGEPIRTAAAWGEGTPFVTLPAPGRGGGGAMYFTVDLNVLRGLLLWNTLGSDQEAQASRVGPGGTITGTLVYLPAMYGNGMKPSPRTGDHNIPDNYLDFSGLNLGSKGCIEFWYHPDWSDWSVGHVVELLWYGSDTGGEIAITYNDWQGYLLVSALGCQEVDVAPAAIPGWSTAHPFHMAVTWDASEPVVTERLKVFVEGARVTPARTFPSSPGAWSPTSKLRVGMRLKGGDWDRHPWEGDHGVFDNLKVWNYPKQDFSDRFQE